MAAPTFLNQSAGATDAGGAWAYTCSGLTGTNTLVIVQILQDGTTNAAISSVVGTNIAALDGTADTWTQIPGPLTNGTWAVGASEEALQLIFLGRPTSAISEPTISGANSTSEDLYIRAYQYLNVSAGTTLATVIENGSAGTANNGTGTSTTVSDTAVTTLGVDRLALNFVAINDDASGLAVFAGASGGTWANFQLYESASGTDGSVATETAAMATAGTIDGGTDTIVSMAWGVVGFALIGTTPAVSLPPTRDPWPWLQAVNRASVW